MAKKIGLSASRSIPIDKYNPIKCSAYFEDTIGENETLEEAFKRIGKVTHQMLEANIAVSTAKFKKIENNEGSVNWAINLMKSDNRFLNIFKKNNEKKGNN